MRRFIAPLVALVLLAPLAASAQQELRDAIKLAILSDRQAQELSQDELGVLIDALYADAVRQGVTAEDITWRPVPEGQLAASSAECGTLCSMTSAFGFDGSNYLIPAMLGASSLLLIFILGAYLGLRHFRHLHPQNMPTPPSVASQ